MGASARAARDRAQLEGRKAPGAPGGIPKIENIILLDRELARIRRIQTLQARLVALSGTAIASVFIGLSSLGSRIAYQFIYGDDAAQAS